MCFSKLNNNGICTLKSAITAKKIPLFFHYSDIISGSKVFLRSKNEHSVVNAICIGKVYAGSKKVEITSHYYCFSLHLLEATHLPLAIYMHAYLSRPWSEKLAAPVKPCWWQITFAAIMLKDPSLQMFPHWLSM